MAILQYSLGTTTLAHCAPNRNGTQVLLYTSIFLPRAERILVYTNVHKIHQIVLPSPRMACSTAFSASIMKVFTSNPGA